MIRDQFIERVKLMLFAYLYEEVTSVRMNGQTPTPHHKSLHAEHFSPN